MLVMRKIARIFGIQCVVYIVLTILPGCVLVVKSSTVPGYFQWKFSTRHTVCTEWISCIHKARENDIACCHCTACAVATSVDKIRKHTSALLTHSMADLWYQCEVGVDCKRYMYIVGKNTWQKLYSMRE